MLRLRQALEFGRTSTGAFVPDCEPGCRLGELYIGEVRARDARRTIPFRRLLPFFAPAQPVASYRWPYHWNCSYSASRVGSRHMQDGGKGVVFSLQSKSPYNVFLRSPGPPSAAIRCSKCDFFRARARAAFPSTDTGMTLRTPPAGVPAPPLGGILRAGPPLRGVTAVRRSGGVPSSQ